MSVTVDVAAPCGRIPVARTTAADVVRAVLRAEGVRDAIISVTFLGDRAMAARNRQYLGRAGRTNVIAFFLPAAEPTAPASGPLVGDIYIAPEVARANARRFGCTVREELVRLLIHGTLHVLGHDHPDGERRTASRMWKRQEQLHARLARARRRR